MLNLNITRKITFTQYVSEGYLFIEMSYSYLR